MKNQKRYRLAIQPGSWRERRVIALNDLGLTDREISRIMAVAPQTITSTLERIKNATDS